MKITVQYYDTTITLEQDHDTQDEEQMGILFTSIMHSMGFNTEKEMVYDYSEYYAEKHEDGEEDCEGEPGEIDS